MIEGSGSGAESGSGSIPLTSGSESGSGRPKNMWIRWIRIRLLIRNTGSNIHHSSLCKSLILHAKINAWHRQVHCPIVRFDVKDADRSGPPSYSENVLVVDGVPLQAQYGAPAHTVHSLYRLNTGTAQVQADGYLQGSYSTGTGRWLLTGLRPKLYTLSIG
jgi:hypothetical protein